MTFFDLIRISEAIGIDTSRLKVINFILEHTNPDTKEFSKSYDVIARETGISFSTVAKTVQLMQKYDMIKPIDKSRWLLTWDVFGNEESETEMPILFRNFGE